MKKIRFLSALLCLALLVTTLAAPALADDNSSSGLVLNKTAVYNENTDDYTITLEAYATGSKVITSVSKDVPTDIVLVLDQSGSMANSMTSTSTTFEAYTNTTNSNLYKYRHNAGQENLYYRLENGSYVSVSVERTATSYTKLDSLVNYKKKKVWVIETGELSDQCYYYYQYNGITLYEKVGDEYKEVTIEYNTVKSNTFTYIFADGTSIISTGDSTMPDFGTHDALYIKNEDGDHTYRYVYTDEAGNVQEIGTSNGDNTSFTEKTLYQKKSSTSSESRMNALKKAVTTFVNEVSKKAGGADENINTADDNVNHRIAIVGFGSKDSNGYNTELLSINGTNSGSVGVRYTKISDQNYRDVLQSMDTAAGQEMVNNAISALATEGATQVDLGMEMAANIFAANPIESEEERNRVVIVFTDGAPTTQSGFSKTVANTAINYSSNIKKSGVTVYTIGIFDGANATSAGTKPNNDLKEKDNSITSASNWFMQNLSSNNGTPQSPSYYLSAADASSLNNIFQQIADQIESGGSATTLDSSTVIKDIIAPQFELPEDATANDIKVYTADCNGIENDKLTFKAREDATGVTASIDADTAAVSVTGFDFSENWCGTETNNGATTYRGKKLIIEFTVKAKDAFLGGNDVYTNTSAGVYANDKAAEPVQEFNRPQVNVPIKDVTVTAADKNVYLLGSLTAAQIKDGTTVKCGDVELKLGEDNYGLEEWQYEYAEVTITYEDADGNAVTDMGELKDDKTYSITATVTPKTITPTTSEGVTAVTKTGSATQKINVFKPELTVTFKDNTVDYKSSIDSTTYVSNKATLEYTKNNLVSVTEVWKHDGTDSKDDTMIGEEPTLDKTYTYSVSEGVESGKVTSTTYVPVKAVVATSINGTPVTEATTITFAHQCEVNGTDKDGNKISCEYWNAETMKDGTPAFLLHVENIYADLTITKTFAKDVTVDEGQSFLFTITGPDDYKNEVIIVGSGSVTIKDLTIGKYTVTEDTGWSWRYTPEGSSTKTKEITANGDNTVTFTNTRSKDKWLDGNASVENVFKDGTIEQKSNNNPGAATN